MLFYRGYVKPVRELLENCKADVNIPNTSGSTSLIQASHFGHAEVVRLLLRHGANVDLPNHKGESTTGVILIYFSFLVRVDIYGYVY